MGPRLLLALALAALLRGAAWGAPPDGERVTVIFRTEPPGARVKPVLAEPPGVPVKPVRGEPPGAQVKPVVGDEVPEGSKDGWDSGTPVHLHRGTYGGVFEVTFELEGHHFPQKTATVNLRELRGDPPYELPGPGQAYRLEPDNAAVALADFWVAYRLLIVPSVLVAVVALAAFVVRRRREKHRVDRAEQLQALQASAAAGSLVGQLLGGYRLVDTLGTGGMATVYRGVRDSDWPPAGPVEEFAVKVIDPRFARDFEFRERFRREVKIGCALDHPGIVRVVDWGDREGLLYLVMEKVDGGSLADLLERGPVPLRRFGDLALPVLEALAFAHERQVVHRDVKPDNILLTRQGRPKVSDFGLARPHDVPTVTVSHTALGTPAYMAPEQLTASSARDPRSDQYALGATFFEMLAGRRAWPGDDPMATLFSRVTEPEPPRLRAAQADLPSSLEGIVARMMARNPEDRYPDLRAVLADLREALAAPPAAARRGS